MITAPVRRLLARLDALASELRSVTVWDDAASDLAGGHRHAVPTLVLAVDGVIRVDGAGRTLDLPAGAALLLAPGVAHRHAPLRRGSRSFSQGFFAGRSDLLLADHVHAFACTVPSQPYRNGFAALLADGDVRRRRQRLADLLASVAEEELATFAPVHPAVRRLQERLWRGIETGLDTPRLLAASGLGRSRTYALCRAAWGAPPARLLTALRLDRALFLLRQGVAVQDCAARCGFRTRAALTAACQRVYGCPPRALSRSGSGADTTR